ncbi:MAG: hypothetical protein DSZ08_03245 [Sulfurovum sp.]|nr:MAG: hypothetical protein DSZ08_03245 [Sulfurovum sp.]
MKVFLYIFVWFFIFLIVSASADPLKDTLLKMKDKSSSSLGMINLDALPGRNQSRGGMQRTSSKAVLATVNGHTIRKRDADKYLKKITKGKIKDYDRLPPKQKRMLLSDLKKMYKIKYFRGRPGNTVIGTYAKGKPVYKKEADAYIKKVTKNKIKDIDRLPRKQRLLVLKDLQRKYKIEHFKGRPKNTIIATVNGHDIYKREADAYIKKVTKNRIKDFDRLDEKQRYLLVKDLAKPMIVKNAIDANVTEMEKEEIFKQMWLGKQRAKIQVSNEEMLTLYEAKKTQILASDPQAKIPTYISLGNSLKNEIIENKIMSNLMKDVNITINFDGNESIENNDSNKSLVKLDKI